MDGDIGNKFFIRKVLEDGTLDPEALANKLADKRYLDLSKTFGFGDFAIPRSKISDFADKIIERYENRQFEAAIGNQNETMRLALNVERELAKLAARDISNDAKWFTVMGTAPLRTVLQTALGLPESLAGIDVDRQLAIFKDRAERQLGTSDVADLSRPETTEKLLRLYFLRGQTDTSATGRSAALTILQSRGTGTGAILSLLV